MFSKACEYAIRATIYTAVHSNEEKRVSLKDIAKAIDSPEAFTAKIMQELSRNRIIDSVKGPNGGFWISERKMTEVKLSQIVNAIDGDAIYKGCGLGLKACSELHPCPVHNKFKKIRNDLKIMLESTSVGELSMSHTEGLSFLKT